jgi:bacterioferritin-associated ferredoxin
MYICICNAVTESSIRQAVRDGARNIFDLIGRTGCSTQCGRCSDLATEVLQDELAAIGAAAGTAARPPVRLRVVSNS